MTDAVWMNVEVSTLSPKARQSYDQYKAAYKLASEARKQFEQAMIADAALPTSKTLAFGYRFGKLSLAVVDAKATTTSNAKPKQSLADFLKANANR